MLHSLIAIESSRRELSWFFSRLYFLPSLDRDRKASRRYPKCHRRPTHRRGSQTVQRDLLRENLMSRRTFNGKSESYHGCQEAAMKV